MTTFQQYGIVPCAYAVPTARPATRFSRVTIEWRDVDRWAIVDGGLVLASDGQWEVERQPSSRTDDFKERTRYPLAEAMQRAVDHFKLEMILK
jgi:hypothetical protein